MWQLTKAPHILWFDDYYTRLISKCQDPCWQWIKGPPRLFRVFHQLEMNAQGVFGVNVDDIVTMATLGEAALTS